MFDLRKKLINDVIHVNKYVSVVLVAVYVALISSGSIATTSWCAIALQTAIALSYGFAAKVTDQQSGWNMVMWTVALLYGAMALVFALGKVAS